MTELKVFKCIKWPNGEIDHADTWEEIERRVQKVQWEDYDSQDEFREDMARRAMYWSGLEIDTFGTSEQFVWELERAQMLIRFEVYGEPPPARGTPFKKVKPRREDVQIEYEVPPLSRPPRPKPAKATRPWNAFYDA